MDVNDPVLRSQVLTVFRFKVGTDLTVACYPGPAGWSDDITLHDDLHTSPSYLLIITTTILTSLNKLVTGFSSVRGLPPAIRSWGQLYNQRNSTSASPRATRDLSFCVHTLETGKVSWREEWLFISKKITCHTFSSVLTHKTSTGNKLAELS